MECIWLHRCRCNDGSSCVLNRLHFSNKIRPAVTFRGAHQEMFPHTFLARTNFERITDRLATLSLVHHDLPPEVVRASRKSPSNGVRKISASFPTTLALLVGSNLLTSARQASNPSLSLLKEQHLTNVEVCYNTATTLFSSALPQSSNLSATVASSSNRASTDLMISSTRPR